MKINGNNLKSFRDKVQKLVDVLNEGIDLEEREKNGEEITEEVVEQWEGKCLVALTRLQEN